MASSSAPSRGCTRGIAACAQSNEPVTKQNATASCAMASAQATSRQLRRGADSRERDALARAGGRRAARWRTEFELAHTCAVASRSLRMVGAGRRLAFAAVSGGPDPGPDPPGSGRFRPRTISPVCTSVHQHAARPQDVQRPTLDRARLTDVWVRLRRLACRRTGRRPRVRRRQAVPDLDETVNGQRQRRGLVHRKHACGPR
jgi:hypothetical protein